jgi:glycosyltransferase involved in cell wall biosynthesis
VEETGAMRVLHISTWDNLGGSGRSAYRLHTGLKALGVQSRMLVGFQCTGADDVRVIGGPVLGRLDRACGGLIDRAGLQYLGYPASLFMTRLRWVREADVIQLFNTHGGYFSHLALGRLSHFRPVVWRLSDMWAVTGHCGYSYECERWRTGCGECPHLAEYPRLPLDTTALLWRVKRRVYDRSRLTIVAPSHWMAGIARESPLLRRFPVRIIPNGVDTQLYHPVPKAAARRALGIDAGARVVLFSANAIGLARKGGAYVEDAMRRVWAEGVRDLTLLIVGEGAGAREPAVPFPTKVIGAVREERRMALAYAAADTFVLPTLAENLPNAILESMACGTPVVAFDVGGVSDAVRHLETGYLAVLGDSTDLAKGIRLLVEDTGLAEKLQVRCREVAENEYPLELQARRFVELYRDVIDRHRAEQVVPS